MTYHDILQNVVKQVKSTYCVSVFSENNIVCLLKLFSITLSGIIIAKMLFIQFALKLATFWLYVLIMSRTHFRVNLHSIVAWMSRNSLFETGAITEVSSDNNGIQTHNLKRTFNHLAKLASLAKFLSVCLRTKWLRVRIS